jgi:hypothetical protein
VEMTGPAVPENGLQSFGDWVLAALEQHADGAAEAARLMIAALRERDWEGDDVLADQFDALLISGCGCTARVRGTATGTWSGSSGRCVIQGAPTGWRSPFPGGERSGGSRTSWRAGPENWIGGMRFGRASAWPGPRLAGQRRLLRPQGAPSFMTQRAFRAAAHSRPR